MPSKMLLSTATLLLSILMSKTSAEFQECPEPSAILPCQCFFGAVLCEGVKNYTDIKVILSGQMHEPFSLSVHFRGTAKLEKGIVDDVKASGLFLDGWTVEFADDAFTDMKNYLRSLHLTFHSLKSIPGAAISKLDKLEFLKITHSGLNIFKSDVDLLPKSIKSIVLFSNMMKHIDPNAFVGLSQLVDFDLLHCFLVVSNLPKTILPSESIKTVTMSYNELTEIPMGNFERARNAKIYLEGNKFSTLPKESVMISFLDRGNSMILDNNYIKCGCDLKWIPLYKEEHSGRINLRGTCYEGQTPVGRIQDLNATSFKDC